MSHDATPWEPPLAGTEVEHLLGALDRLRATFRWKADALDEQGLRAGLGSSSLTLGGLLKHLALVETYSSTVKLDGSPLGEPWETVLQDDGAEFSWAAEDSVERVYALWDTAVEGSRRRFDAALADGGLDRPVNVAWSDGRHANLRRLLFDLVEEYGRHTGHADLLREAVDGRVGEDPPPGWIPKSTAGGSS